MPEARQIGLRFAILGVALMVQGCWDEEFAFVGKGACRTADNGRGVYTEVSNIAFNECKAQCFDGNGPCTAIEYSTEGGVCEIHSGPITKYETVEDVRCYFTK